MSASDLSIMRHDIDIYCSPCSQRFTRGKGRACIRVAYLAIVLIIWTAVIVPLSCADEPEVVLDEDAELLYIDGLSFACDGCRLERQGIYRLYFADDEEGVACAELLPEIVERTAAKDYDGEHPSTAEIRSYLLLVQAQPKVADYLLELLCSTSAGRAAMALEASRLFSRYREQVSRLIHQGQCGQQSWMAVYQLPREQGIEIDERLAIAIIDHHPDLGIEEVLNRIGRRDVKAAEELLAVYEEVLEALKSDLLDAVRRLRKLLQMCAIFPEEGQIPDACKRSEFDKLPQRAAGFLHDVQLTSLLTQLEQGNISPRTILDRVLLVAPNSYSDQRVLRLVAGALNAASKTDDKNSIAELLSGERMKLIEETAKHEQGVRYYAGLLLTLVAEDLWSKKEGDRALDMLHRSFRTYKALLRRRDRFYSELVKDEAVQQNKRWRRELEDMHYEVSGEERPPVKRETVLISVIHLMNVVGLLFIGLLFAYLRRRHREEKEKKPLDNSEVIELNEILKIFELPLNVRPDELSKVFRQRAKELHPDAGVADLDAFKFLSDKYSRAKELMSRRKYTPGFEEFAEKAAEGKAAEEASAAEEEARIEKMRQAEAEDQKNRSRD